MSTLAEHHVVQQPRGNQQRQVTALERHERPHRALVGWPELLGERGHCPHAASSRLLRRKPRVEGQRREQYLPAWDRWHHEGWAIGLIREWRQVGRGPCVELGLSRCVGSSLRLLRGEQGQLAEGGVLGLRKPVG